MVKSKELIYDDREDTGRFELKRHQVYASEMMDNLDALALYYEAGTGKTMCVLDWAYRNAEKGTLNSLLVICPASITGVWASAIDKMIQFKGYTKEGILRLKSMVTIRSFQKTYRSETRTVAHRDGSKSKVKQIALREDIDHYWTAIVVDEAHAIGIHNSIQTKAALTLSLKADRRYILTGTPISGGGGGGDYKKLYGQLKFLDNKVWGSYSDFCKKYVTAYDVFRKPARYRVKELNEIMKEYAIVARLDMCEDMPEYSDIVVPVENREPAIYKKVRKGDTEDYGFKIRTSGTQYIKLLELVSGFLKADSTDIRRFNTSKTDALTTLITSTDDKVVIFCNYRDSIDRVKEICEKKGETVVFDGRSTSDTWRDFQYGGAQYLICQYQSGGVGIDLFASHTMIFYEPTTSSLLAEQARARIRRKGQTQRCIYYWLATANTIEANVVESVRAGVDVTRDMLEGWAMLEDSHNKKKRAETKDKQGREIVQLTDSEGDE